MSGLNAKQIAIALGKLKIMYYDVKKDWINNQAEEK
jgi:hypothetical protein